MRIRRDSGRRTLVTSVSVIVTIGLLTIPASAATGTPAWKAQLNKQVPAALKKSELPGAIVGVWQNGKRVYLKAFGVAETKKGATLKADSHVWIGSLTKAFTVTGILQLVDDGKLALGRPDREVHRGCAER